MSKPPANSPASMPASRARRRLGLVDSSPSSGRRAIHRLTRNDLFSPEAYAAEREAFRAKLIRHRQARRIDLGTDLWLQFESRLTVQYRIQEELRLGRIVQPEAIQSVLDRHNPLLPDGSNLKATMQPGSPRSEPGDHDFPPLPATALHLYARVASHPRIHAIAESSGRSREDDSSAVDFLRLEFPPDAISSLRDGEPLVLGIDHDQLRLEVETAVECRRALLADFD